MMRSMFSGVSGLSVHQTRMDVIANNISNVNTVGFKSSRVLFSDVFSQTVQSATGANIEGTGRGGVNAMQIGLGAQVASIDRMMTQGAAQRTDHAFDLMLEGDGFFVVGDASGTFFTRNGAIRPDAFGNLTISNGMQLMGWEIGGNEAEGWEVQRGQVQGLTLRPEHQSIPPTPTTVIEFGGNIVPEGGWRSGATGGVAVDIPAQAVVTMAPPTTANGYLWTATWPAGGTAPNDWEAGSAVYVAPEVNMTMQVHDSLGRLHTLDVILEKTPAGANGVTIWNITMPQIEGPTAGSVVEFAVAFGPNGQMIASREGHQTAQIPVPGAPPAPLLPAADWSDDPETLNIVLNAPVVPAAVFGSPTATAPITIDFSGLTQFGSVRQNPTATNMDGRAAGELTDLSIGQDGTVMGLFTNGMMRPIFQIPIAEFVNPAGLESVGGSLFRQTINSGSFDGIGRDGNMRGGVLEMSNVDISSEFTDMIITQRGFQANSRTISTSSDMLQELVNLGR